MAPTELDREIRNASAALSGYYRAERMLTEIQESGPKRGEAELKLWILAARNLQLRARFALLLLYRRGYHELVFTDKIRDDLLEMREKTEAMYQDKLTGDCMRRFLYILFDLPLKTLQALEQTIPLLP